MNTIYISDNGNDNNPGTEELPLRTFAAALERSRTLENTEIDFRFIDEIQEEEEYD